MEAVALTVAVISALIALAALVRDNNTRKLVQRTVLAPDLRPLLESTRDALGRIVAQGGRLKNEDKDAVSHADRRLPELLPGIIDADLRGHVVELAEHVREVFARGPIETGMFAAFDDEVFTSETAQSRAAATATGDAARAGQEAALAALQRLSTLQAGGE